MNLLMCLPVLYWSLVTGAQVTSPIVVTPLPDGVSIQGGESLRQVVASWDVYVTLDPPVFPEELGIQVNNLDTAFDAVRTLERISIHIDLTALKLRRDRLHSILQTKVSHRAKRGLLDVGGSILSVLFGVATTSQLDRFKAAVVELADNQKDMGHAYNQLATIVNQTKTYTHRLALQQHHIERQMRILHSAINDLFKASQAHDRRLRSVEIAADLNRYVDILEMAAHAYERQVNLFHRQRAELEAGHLTRHLLSEDRLTEILQQAISNHQVISSNEWYYQHLSVTPIRQDTENLLYKVELPLIAPRPYILYNVLAHPVPVSNASVTVHLQLNKAYAIDTVSGNLFTPKFCLGHSPVVCQTGPEFDQSHMQCARGLITNRPRLIKTCKVAVKSFAGAPLIESVDVNQYLITSLGETLVIRCPGRAESHLQLPRGAHNVTCLSPCTITGQGWTITCINRLYLTRRYMMPVVQVTTLFNFSVTIETQQLHNVLPSFSDLVGPLDLITDIATIYTPHDASNHFLKDSPLSIITMVNVTCIAIIISLLSAFFLAWHKFRSRTLRLNTIFTQALPLATPNSPTVNPPDNSPPRTSIWPVLPPISNCFNHAQPTVESTTSAHV